MTSEAACSLSVSVSDVLTRRALAAAPMGVVVADPTVDGTPIRYANDAFRRLTGYAAEEALGRPIDFHHDVSIDDHVRTAVDTRERTSVLVESLRKDGTRRWTHVELVPLVDDGAVSHLVGYQRDVTESRARERRATARQRRFEALHDASRELVDAASSADIARAVTDAAERALDPPRATVHLADSDRLRVVDGSAADVPVDGDSAVARAYRDGEPAAHDDGDAPRRVSVPVGEYGVLSLRSDDAFDDATAELLARLAAGALSRLRDADGPRLERFADIVAHDLRNPLNIARGRLELARETYESQDLDDVADAHERMATLIDDLLALASEGRTATDAEPLDLERVARDCWRFVETPDARLRVADTCRLRADESDLGRLFENLFRNSVEHGSTNNRMKSDDSVEHGSTTDTADLTVTVGPLDDENGFYVEDDGVGIPPQTRDRVFEDGYSTASDSTGFGLSIVERVADVHGWSVRIADRPGGARFEFTGVDPADDA